MADTQQGVGFDILKLKIETLEDKLKELKNEVKQQDRDNVKKFDEINDRVDDLSSSITRIEVMFTNIVTSQSEMKDDIKSIASSDGKDSGWRALITDILKAVILIAGFFATGKWLG